jgi:hypothetical protein
MSIYKYIIATMRSKIHKQQNSGTKYLISGWYTEVSKYQFAWTKYKQSQCLQYFHSFVLMYWYITLQKHGLTLGCIFIRAVFFSQPVGLAGFFDLKACLLRQHIQNPCIHCLEHDCQQSDLQVTYAHRTEYLFIAITIQNKNRNYFSVTCKIIKM